MHPTQSLQVPCGKVPITAGALVSRAIPRQSAATRHTTSTCSLHTQSAHRKLNHRPYTTIRPPITQARQSSTCSEFNRRSRTFQSTEHQIQKASHQTGVNGRYCTNTRTAHHAIPQRSSERPNNVPVIPKVKSLVYPRQPDAVSLRSRSYHWTDAGLSAHWLRNQLLQASPVGPVDVIVTLCARPA